jgi:hypothetical protein
MGRGNKPTFLPGVAAAVICLFTAASGAAVQVTEIQIDPRSVRLGAPGQAFQLLVHGKTAAGRVVDLTRVAEYTSHAPDVVTVDARGVVRGLRDGKASITLRVAGAAGSTCEVTVAAVSGPRAFNFERDVTPLLSRYGCNSAGCHGKAEGQNGFKLSVFGYDPGADYDALLKHGRGRRVSPAIPDQSLVLLKMSGAVPHGGGERVRRDSPEYRTVRDWVAAGAPFGEPADPKVRQITLAPAERVLSVGGSQQLRVVATYDDDREADVTGLAQFQSNNEGVAAVDEAGLVSAGDVPGQAAIMARYMGHVAVFRALVPRPQPVDRYPGLPRHNFIDDLVEAQLRKLNIVPSDPADDPEFLRRVYLDIIGTLPTSDEVRTFLADTRSDRRARLVDQLLDRPEYADYWSLKWADLLRVDRQALGHRGAYGFYRWLRESLAANKPADHMVREVLTAEGPLAEAGQGAFYRAFKKPGDTAAAVSQVFLGVRIACAECHHHPFDRWGQADYYGMQAFFQGVTFKDAGDAGSSLTIAGSAEATNPRTGKPVYAHPLGTTAPQAPPVVGDPRPALADWLTSPQNSFFARNLANRMVAHFLGRGLVEPVDDVRATNPPSNPELLDALAAHLVESNFDVKQLVRTITASRTYQTSSRPNETNERDEQNYSRALFKRLPAEVLLDAVCQTTGVGEKFPGVPAGRRAVRLWDSDVPHYFLGLFGRPVRKTPCDCERNADASIAQVLHLMNSPEIQAKLSHESGRVSALVRTLPDDGALADELYLTFFARLPAEAERRDAIAYLRRAGVDGRRAAAEDLAWGLMNSLEFVFNH